MLGWYLLVSKGTGQSKPPTKGCLSLHFGRKSTFFRRTEAPYPMEVGRFPMRKNSLPPSCQLRSKEYAKGKNPDCFVSWI